MADDFDRFTGTRAVAPQHAFNMFRLANILQGIMARTSAGATSLGFGPAHGGLAGLR